MNVLSTFALGLMLLAVSSCANQYKKDREFIEPFYKIHYQEVVKFKENNITFGQEYDNWLAKVKSWKQKQYDFMKSLSNQEL